ncbi:MAG: TAXI family TRAP transporter solute-binding subunit [Pseudomonadales bacterium]
MLPLSAVLCLLLLFASMMSAASDAKLPRAMAWTAYNLGTTGYNQAVGISKMLRNKHRVTLRIIPGKNDVSRMLPLMVGRVQFSANGVATYFAQEGTFQFASRRWGPVPVRLVMMSVGLSNQAVAVAANSGITDLSQLRGKRIPWVHGAPSINVSIEAMLACGNVGWDEVERIEFPGYNAMWNGIIDGHVDTAYATTVSGPTRKLEASPRGIRWLSVPHEDEGCWQRLLGVAPYFSRNTATRGAAISETNPHEGATYPYPLLMTLAAQSDELVYNLTEVLHLGYDDYKSADPGSIGWSMARQRFDWVVPFHAGAVRYFEKIGVWNEAFAANNERLLERQQVLQDAWQELANLLIEDDTEFTEIWMKLRALRLESKGFDPVWR